MAGIETYGGCCPQCTKGMEQKYESSHGGFMFDACPWCGFIYATIDGEHQKDERSMWDAILHHADVSTREELINKYKYESYTPKENKEFYPSIFNYSTDEGTTTLYKLLWKQYGSENKEGFSLEGVRVQQEDTKRLGTITEYNEGIIYIQWDEPIEPNSPHYECSGMDLGKTIILVDNI